MTREEAINKIKSWSLDPDDMEVLSAAIPELREESEDERILEWIIGIVNSCKELSFKDKVKLTRYLERQKEQKPVECLKAERDGWYVCIKDYYRGGKKQCSVGDLVQAKGGMFMMGEEDISEWFRRAYYEEVRDAFKPNANINLLTNFKNCFS